jgi:acetyltransferase-like isoleucine patch superfamily enzyme
MLLTGSMLALLVQLLILHYETRYFRPLRLCFVLLIIFVFSELSTQPIRLSQKRSGAKVHPSAVCETFSVGRGTRIWSNVHVLSGAKIGEDCNICEFVFIENNVVIGNRTTIKSGVQVWDQIVIGNDVFIGPNATFTNDKYPVSKGSFDQNLVTRIENGVSIGAGAIILPGITIGENSLIGAGALVTKDVPPGSICVGVPGVSRKRSIKSTPIKKP